MTDKAVNLIVVEQGLIPIYINGNAEDRLVDARELHGFLGVGKDFSTWIKDRIRKYGFVENEDYSSFTKIGERAIGGTTSIEYALTLDVAKEIAMVQNNEQGRAARKYFIEVEKRYTRMLEDKLLSFGKVAEVDKALIDLKTNRVIISEKTKMARALLTKYVAFGIEKSEAVVIIQSALNRGEYPDQFVEEKLRELRNAELQRKRGRIYVRIQRLGSLLQRVYPEMEEPYEEAWHYLADELVFEAGMTKNLRKRHEADKKTYEELNRNRPRGQKKQKTPGYLDYIQEGNLYKEAEKVAGKLIRKYSRLADKIAAVQAKQTEEVADVAPQDVPDFLKGDR